MTGIKIIGEQAVRAMHRWCLWCSIELPYRMLYQDNMMGKFLCDFKSIKHQLA